METEALIKFLVRRAWSNPEPMTALQRADLWEATALVLDGDEATHASQLAVELRRTEQSQQDFFNLLNQ